MNNLTNILTSGSGWLQIVSLIAMIAVIVLVTKNPFYTKEYKMVWYVVAFASPIISLIIWLWLGNKKEPLKSQGFIDMRTTVAPAPPAVNTAYPTAVPTANPLAYPTTVPTAVAPVVPTPVAPTAPTAAPIPDTTASMPVTTTVAAPNIVPEQGTQPPVA